MENIDLTDLLKDWPYEPGNVNVRLIRATAGRPLIQLRVDLGILQMELEGRPDGEKPEGFPSLLDYHLKHIEVAQAEAGTDAEGAETADSAEADEVAEEELTPEKTEYSELPDGKNESGDDEEIAELEGETKGESEEEEEEEEVTYVILEAECRSIREEAVQYYHRYIGLYALDEFDAVFADASHNLGLIDLCRHYGESEEDREAMEQLRLHTMMTRTRAHAASVAANGNSKGAVEAIDQGLAEIEALLEAVGVSEEDFDSIGEVQLLKGMRDSLVPKLPGSQKMELRERLKAALSAENFELAAILRDEIRMMKD